MLVYQRVFLYGNMTNFEKIGNIIGIYCLFWRDTLNGYPPVNQHRPAHAWGIPFGKCLYMVDKIQTYATLQERSWKGGSAWSCFCYT